jgi:hypothetical protein
MPWYLTQGPWDLQPHNVMSRVCGARLGGLARRLGDGCVTFCFGAILTFTPHTLTFHPPFPLPLAVVSFPGKLRPSTKHISNTTSATAHIPAQGMHCRHKGILAAPGCKLHVHSFEGAFNRPQSAPKRRSRFPAFPDDVRFDTLQLPTHSAPVFLVGGLCCAVLPESVGGCVLHSMKVDILQVCLGLVQTQGVVRRRCSGAARVAPFWPPHVSSPPSRSQG